MLKPITPQSTDRFACLIVGPAGIGKTSLLRTLCGQSYKDGKWVKNDDIQPERVFVLSAESGLLCVRDLVVNGQIEGVEISSLSDFREAQRAIITPQFKEKGYKWLFIDSLTEIAARCEQEQKSKFPDKGDSFKKWEEYNHEMTTIVKAFRDIRDYNVVFTCLEAFAKDKDDILRVIPDMQGTQLKNRLTSYFDEVFYMERVRQPDGTFEVMFDTRNHVGLSKDRSGVLKPYETANLLNIYNKILG